MSFPRYPSYKDSGVEWLGEVPKEWEILPLKRTCHVFPSNVDKKSYDDEININLCNYTDVYYNETIVAGMDFMAATATADQITKFTLRAGDTIITKDSESADDIAIAAYVPEDLPGIVCGYHLSMIRPTLGFNGAFIKRLFDSRYAKARFQVLANGLTRMGLGQYALDNIKFAFPTHHEQQTIATFLDRETAKIDALVAEQENLIALLKEKRQAVISHAVTKGLDPTVPMKDSGIEWLGEVPAHWVILRLRNTANIVRGASPRPAGDPRFFSEEKETSEYIPWLTVAEITKDQLSHVDSTEKYLTPYGVEQSQTFLEGTLVLSNSGATLGVPKILGMTCCANDGVLAFRSLASRVNIMFAYYFLMSLTERLREYMKNGAQPNLNTDLVKGIAFSLPDPFEQLEIVAFLDTEIAKLDTLTAEAQRAIDLLKERRSALISAAVTGKIDVRGYRAQPPPII